MAGNKPGDVKILGPASNRPTRGPDVSVLKPSIRTTVTGMKQAVHCLETGSLEVKRVLLNEANLVYECRVCLNMFRSLANLVAHKRTFCRAEYGRVQHRYPDHGDKENLTTVLVQPEDTDCCSEVDTWNLDNYSPSMDLIRTSGLIQEILDAPLVNKLKPDKSISGIASRLSGLAAGEPGARFRTDKSKPETETKRTEKLVLEPMFNTSNALYQSWKVSDSQESIKDVHRSLNFSRLVDDHIVVRRQEGESADQEEGEKEHSEKVEPDNGSERLVLRMPCLLCKAHFQEWRSVRRHLLNIHGKDLDFVTSNRDLVMKKAFQGPPGKWDAKHAPVVSEAKLNLSTGMPVKSVKVDLTKVPLEKTDICKLVGDVPVCPLLQKNIFPPHNDSEESRVSEISPDPEEDPIPEEVERKIMESVNRRHLQCRVCYKRFRGTAQAQRHVASIHLKLHRFCCSVCGFGAWTRKHVVRHVTQTHRSRGGDSAVSEQSKEVYFANYLPQEEEKAVDPPTENLPPTGTIIGHNLSDFRTQDVATCTEECGNSRVPNGTVINDFQADMVPVSLIAGIKSQLLPAGSGDDGPRRGSDEEVSFKEIPRSKRRRSSGDGTEQREPPAKLNKEMRQKEEGSPSLISKMMMALPSSLWSSVEKSTHPVDSKPEIQFRSPTRTASRSKDDDEGAERTVRNTRQRASSEVRSLRR